MPLSTTDNIKLLSTGDLDETMLEKATLHHVQLDTASFIAVQAINNPGITTQVAEIAADGITVIFTSVHAVEVVVQLLPAHSALPLWNIYCLGGATFTAVKKYWPYSQVKATAKSAGQLAGKILRDNIRSAIFFCGDQRRHELPDLLKTTVQLREIVVYKTVLTPVKVSTFYNGILFYSPSAVDSFFSANRLPPETVIFSIGNTTATAVKNYSNNALIVSDFPAKDHLLRTALNYFTGNPVL